MSSCSRTRTKAPRSARSRRNGGFSSSSATIVADIDDVLIQILSFLPIKTLLRFKRVSKRWLSLITNPVFSNRVIKSNHPLPISGFFLHSPREIKYSFVSLDDDATNQRISSSLPLWFTDHQTDMIIMQSTNGLLLCKCSCASSNHFNTNYYVYNPTTKQYTLLPQIAGHIALSLAFDPSRSPHYKVFCLRGRSNNSFSSASDSELYHIEVYSSNEGLWRRVVPVPTSPSTFIEFSYSVFWNGAVNWYGFSSRDCLSFDINTQEIKILPLPDHEHEDEPLPDPRTLMFLDESQGNLYYIEVNNQSSSNLRVYEMESNSSSWSVKYNVDLEPLAAAFPEMIRTEYYTDRRIYAFSVIGFVKEETDAASYILLHIPNQAVKYNFIDKTFKKLCDFKSLVNDAPEDHFYRFQRTFQFIKSLANV
ncbi:F-box protein [Arabidopsis thaliana]|uniref:F-box domain n=3 Tax=Arabidopsis TaxID=3701 RepID=A0A8T2DMK6_ARASU|nr:F-box domain [Arabidopsis thaliana x Arabidopsis arenosa]KAG7608461.1 F-box domain [Arabidopsis suecica]OAO93332.1 hypothetical protein AXX17_AT5G07340 [Arabidopsis thaliana]CAA0401293.1 unnamed protein product [Arabidopsis thaliana]CAD5331095.1 unnamed protein product [Arabidopsis thaliana]